MKQLNFGRNVEIDAQASYAPKTEQEVLDILDTHKGQSIRCIGRLHSWSQILDSPGVLLDLRNLNAVQIHSDDPAKSVEAGAGCQIKRLLKELDQQKQWTLPSVGFITEQTVAGAVSTGTHGSGRNSLSHYVLSARVARYDSETGEAAITEISGGDELLAVRCSLGCLGVILSVTMQCREKYSVEEHFCEHQTLAEVVDAEAEFPLQQFYLIPWLWTWIAQHRREQAGRNSRLLPLFHWYRFIVFDVSMHLLILMFVRVFRLKASTRFLFRWILPNFVVRKWKIVGPATSQLVMEHEMFRHVEIELFVQRPQLESAMEFLKSSLEVAGGASTKTHSSFQSQVKDAECESKLEGVRGTYTHHYPICVRRIRPDETLISMASCLGLPGDSPSNDSPPAAATSSSSDWFSITLTNYHRGKSRQPFYNLAAFLAVSMSRLFAARPHWGKLCPLAADELTKLYPGFSQFKKVCEAMDPERHFSNPWTEQLLGSVEPKQN